MLAVVAIAYTLSPVGSFTCPKDGYDRNWQSKYLPIFHADLTHHTDFKMLTNGNIDESPVVRTDLNGRMTQLGPSMDIPKIKDPQDLIVGNLGYDQTKATEGFGSFAHVLTVVNNKYKSAFSGAYPLQTGETENDVPETFTGDATGASKGFRYTFQDQHGATATKYTSCMANIGKATAISDDASKWVISCDTGDYASSALSNLQGLVVAAEYDESAGVYKFTEITAPPGALQSFGDSVDLSGDGKTLFVSYDVQSLSLETSSGDVVDVSAEFKVNREIYILTASGAVTSSNCDTTKPARIVEVNAGLMKIVTNYVAAWKVNTNGICRQKGDGTFEALDAFPSSGNRALPTTDGSLAYWSSNVRAYYKPTADECNHEADTAHCSAGKGHLYSGFCQKFAYQGYGSDVTNDIQWFSRNGDIFERRGKGTSFKAGITSTAPDAWGTSTDENNPKVKPTAHTKIFYDVAAYRAAYSLTTDLNGGRLAFGTTRRVSQSVAHENGGGMIHVLKRRSGSNTGWFYGEAMNKNENNLWHAWYTGTDMDKHVLFSFQLDAGHGLGMNVALPSDPSVPLVAFGTYDNDCGHAQQSDDAGSFAICEIGTAIMSDDKPEKCQVGYGTRKDQMVANTKHSVQIGNDGVGAFGAESHDGHEPVRLARRSPHSKPVYEEGDQPGTILLAKWRPGGSAYLECVTNDIDLKGTRDFGRRGAGVACAATCDVVACNDADEIHSLQSSPNQPAEDGLCQKNGSLKLGGCLGLFIPLGCGGLIIIIYGLNQMGCCAGQSGGGKNLAYSLM